MPFICFLNISSLILKKILVLVCTVIIINTYIYEKKKELLDL